MRITGFEFLPLSLPVRTELRVARGGAYTRFEPIVIRVHTDSSIVGVGEVQCFPAYDREGPVPPAGAMALLMNLGQSLLHLDPFDVEGAWESMDRRVFGHIWVKSGLDLALFDLMGKALNLNASRLIGGHLRTTHIAEGIGFTTSLNYSPQEVARTAIEAVGAGFRELELKAGDPDPEKDYQRLKAIREAIGTEVSIKVDFNSKGDTRATTMLIRRMERHGIQAVEQPAEAWDIQGLAEVRKNIETPVIADECVRSTQDLLRVIEARAADEIHIKPPVKGGLSGAVKLRTLAEAAGLKVVPGTLCPTGIGMGAVHAFLASTKEVGRGVHPTPLEVLVEDIVEEPLPFSPIINILDGPGLGFSLDEKKLERFRHPAIEMQRLGGDSSGFETAPKGGR